ncbi:MAG: hypothetical protein HQK52_14270 [Oligoflexia bacterium]|nr:hypothetical protein [Oligoflexia bacterium]
MLTIIYMDKFLTNFHIVVMAIINLLAINCFEAYAGRILHTPSTELTTMHGGSNGTLSCNGADMLPGPHYGPANGVRLVSHHYSVVLRNLSNIAQTVSLSVSQGTSVYSSNSGGFANPIPVVNGPTYGVSSDTPLYVNQVIGPTSQLILEVTSQCSSSACILFPLEAKLACNTQTEQICLGQTTNMGFIIDIKEDRGALSGYILASTQRCFGYVDHYLSQPPVHPINGGRAF